MPAAYAPPWSYGTCGARGSAGTRRRAPPTVRSPAPSRRALALPQAFASARPSAKTATVAPQISSPRPHFVPGRTAGLPPAGSCHVSLRPDASTPPGCGGCRCTTTRPTRAFAPVGARLALCSRLTSCVPVTHRLPLLQRLPLARTVVKPSRTSGEHDGAKASLHSECREGSQVPPDAGRGAPRRAGRALDLRRAAAARPAIACWVVKVPNIVAAAACSLAGHNLLVINQS